MMRPRFDDSSALRVLASVGGSRPQPRRWRITARIMAVCLGVTTAAWHPVAVAQVPPAPTYEPEELPEPPPPQEPDASTSDCADDALRRADAKVESGFTASAAQLYEDAYRCLTPRQRRGPRGVSIVMVAVDAYKRTVLQDAELEGMLGRARQLVDEHLAFLEEQPDGANPADERRLEELRAEIELLSTGLRCRRDPASCGPKRSRIDPVARGLIITGSIVALAGTVFTTSSGTTLRLIEIRKDDLAAVAGAAQLAARREDLVERLDEQAKGQYLILGLSLAGVVVGGTMLVAGLVQARRRSQRHVSVTPTGFVVRF